MSRSNLTPPAIPATPADSQPSPERHTGASEEMRAGFSILDLFAGPGGWDIAAQRLGHDPLGVEWDDAACETRKAAGLRTLQGDVAQMDPAGFGDIDLLIASPPCQAWSMAGKRLGEKDKQHVIACAHELAAGHDRRRYHGEQCEDNRSMLVVEPLRFISALKPAYVALEQVPPVLELWTLFATFLEQWGYSVWTGVLEAERYGVPQTRERAILIASLNGPVAPPAPTHQRYIPGEPQRHDITFEGEILPWVSMAEALGWTGSVKTDNFTAKNYRGQEGVKYERTAEAPAPVLTGRGDRWERLPHYRRTRGEGMTERNGERRDHPPDEPASAVTSKARSDEWVYDVRAGGHAAGYTRDCEDPATITGGHDTGDRVWTEDRPAPTIVTTRRSKDGIVVGRQLPAGEGENVGGRNWKGEDRLGLKNPDWPEKRPSTTVAGDPRIFQPGNHREDVPGEQSHNAVRVTEAEAATLQSFPPDYPWQGSRSKRFEQIGNAVPPLLAEAILRALLGEEASP